MGESKINKNITHTLGKMKYNSHGTNKSVNAKQVIRMNYIKERIAEQSKNDLQKNIDAQGISDLKTPDTPKKSRNNGKVSKAQRKAMLPEEEVFDYNTYVAPAHKKK